VRERLAGVAHQPAALPVPVVFVFAEGQDAVIRPGPTIADLGDEMPVIVGQRDPVAFLERLDHGDGQRRV